MTQRIYVSISVTALSLCAACSSSTNHEDREISNDQPATMAVLEQPLSEQAAITLLKSAQVRPLEFVTTFAGGLQAGYVLQPSDTVDSALISFKEKHEEFLQFIQSQLDEQAASAPPDEDASTRSMREALAKDIQTATEEFHSGSLQIARLRLLKQDAEVLKTVVKLNEIILPTGQADTSPTPESPGLHTLSTSHETWAPYTGHSQVSQYLTYQDFYFNNVTQFTANSASTYEHEAQVYDKNFADYSGYWESNMPSAYYDTPFLDTIDNFTVGSAQASSLVTYTQYHTYMSLTPGSASTATVRIKGQIGHRYPSWCYSTWCIFADFTSGSMDVFTAPSSLRSWSY